MRVLVTGGAGRLGRSVAAFLADAGHDVVSVDLRPGNATYDTFAADLTEPGDAYAATARVRPEAVVHLAAIAVPFSAPEPTIHAVNSRLVFNVLQAAVDLGVRTVVIASSPTIIGYGNPLGWAPHYLPIDEDHPIAPWHAYGLSKVVAEETMRAFARQTGDRVRFAAFRPGYVIAPEEWKGAPTQQGHTVRERLDDPALGATSLFNYLDARDAGSFVDTLLREADRIDNAETFFVTAADALAREPLADLLPRFHPGTAVRGPTLTGTAPAFAVGKAKRLLGWEPRHRWRTELTTD